MSAGSHGLPDFLATTEAVLMGRTTFVPALGAPQWPWRQPVFVVTGSGLPAETPDDVTAAPTPEAALAAMEAAGVRGDVHLVGGPTTMRSFAAIGALAELRLHVAPVLLGEGTPLSPPGSPRMELTHTSTREFPDGVVELGYTVG